MILRRARNVVVLDRFMAERTLTKRDVAEKLTVLPPWSPTDDLGRIEHADNPFRAEHGLADKFVIMYSGNIGPASPVDTILDAAQSLHDDPRLLFLFIGGGTSKQAVDERIQQSGAPNVRTLPYQPIEALKYSLAAADVHVVTVGQAVVGICHPCKVYGAMAVGRPILLLGPDPCHVSDIIKDQNIGWRIEPGDVDGAVNTIQQIAATDPEQLLAMGERAMSLMQERFSRTDTCRRFCDLVERGL